MKELNREAILHAFLNHLISPPPGLPNELQNFIVSFGIRIATSLTPASDTQQKCSFCSTLDGLFDDFAPHESVLHYFVVHVYLISN